MNRLDLRLTVPRNHIFTAPPRLNYTLPASSRLNYTLPAPPRLNFTITAPQPLIAQQAQNSFSQSSVRTIDPRDQASSGLSDCLSDAWQAVVRFFKSLLSCFGLCSNAQDQDITLSPTQREERLCATESIQGRLTRQMQRSLQQMAQEPVKPFRYLNAPDSWDAHEEMVGGLRVGVSHIRGRRPTMEDEHLAVSFNLSLDGRNYPIQLFGIFDGHGGPMAARFVRDHLQTKLQAALIEYNPRGLSDAGIWKALKMTGVRLNRDFKNTHGQIANNQGTTATIAMILDHKLWTANVGDARTVLDNNGTPIQLTEDAKPNDERYRRGIEHRGGTVMNMDVPRVNGILAVARSIGDHRLNGAISARSKVTVKPLSEIQPGSHLILCCDGVYDVSRTVDVVDAAHNNRTLSQGTLARNITYSAYQAGSNDNLSALVVEIR